MTQTTKLAEANLVVQELDQSMSRTQATLKNNTGATMIFVVGQTLITTTGKRTPAAASDADSVLVSCGDGKRSEIALANDAEAEVGIIRGGSVTLNRDALVFLGGLTNNQRLAQIAALKTRSIMIREPFKQGDESDVLTEDEVDLLEMVGAGINDDDPDFVTVQYSGDVDASDFDATAFSSEPSGSVGVSAEQLDTNQINVVMDGDIVDDTSFVYTGSVPGILTPQTIDL